MKKDKIDVVLFGFGIIGKKIIPILREKYNIIRWADNDKNKVGLSYEGMTICSSKSIVGLKCKIIIATGREAFVQISNQLLGEGFSEKQLYFVTNSQDLSVIPYECEELKVDNNITLVEYDQLRNSEDKQCGDRVLILCSFYTPFVIQPIRNILSRYPEYDISLLTSSNDYNDSLYDKVKHIYVYKSLLDLARIINLLPQYDTVHMLWMEFEWAYFSKMICAKAGNSIVTIGGSDFYRSSDAMKKYYLKLLSCVDKINCQTPSVTSDFLKVFPFLGEMIVNVNYGFEALDYIPKPHLRKVSEIKGSFGFPLDKYIITCGHNASEAHQHIAIIDALSQLDDSTKSSILCVFPMTYPNNSDEYINTVENKIRQTGIDYRILSDYLDVRQIAKYAQISDIMIHVQTTDMSSATMLEEMYAGAIVVAGSWLPYKWLRENGLFFVSVDEIQDVTQVIGDIVTRIDVYKEKCINNRQIVHDFGSWDVCAKKWIEMWR